MIGKRGQTLDCLVERCVEINQRLKERDLFEDSKEKNACLNSK